LKNIGRFQKNNGMFLEAHIIPFFNVKAPWLTGWICPKPILTHLKGAASKLSF